MQRLISPKDGGGQGAEQEAQGVIKGRIIGVPPANSSLTFIRLNSHSNDFKINTGDET